MDSCDLLPVGKYVVVICKKKVFKCLMKALEALMTALMTIVIS